MSATRNEVFGDRALERDRNANYVIESKLQQVDQSARLTVQLIDSATANTVWSQRFVRTLSDSSALLEDFAVAVAAELVEQIIQIEARAAMARAGPLPAWQHVMRYMAYISSPSTESMGKAIEEARLALAAGPNFGLAHALLAAGLAGHIEIGLIERNDAVNEEIRIHAERAMELDGANPMVIAYLSAAYSASGQGETGLRLALRAVELHPYSPRPYVTLGLAYMRLGRTAEAIAALTQQVSMTTVDSARVVGLSALGACYALEGKLTEAENALDKSLALAPNSHLSLKWKAIVAAQLGKQDIALGAVQQLRVAAPTMSIDQLVRQIRQIRQCKPLAERSAKAIATLQHVWGVKEPGK
jgi:tetratricopeptide (TPR) repeat protein